MDHIVVTHTDGNIQKIYFNGRQVASHSFAASSRREDYGDRRINASKVADIFIGGGGVYKSGFNGIIDEVQVWSKPLSDDEVLQAMKGYKEGQVPTDLKAYFTFEEANGMKFKTSVVQVVLLMVLLSLLLVVVARIHQVLLTLTKSQTTMY